MFQDVYFPRAVKNHLDIVPTSVLIETQKAEEPMVSRFGWTGNVQRCEKRITFTLSLTLTLTISLILTPIAHCLSHTMANKYSAYGQRK